VEELEWLTGLPPRLTVQLDDIAFELCHGAPDDLDRYVYPTASEEELASCEIAGSIVLMGHTHYPMISPRSACALVNPGSVGQARDLGGFASWMLMDTTTRMIAPRRTAFDASSVVKEAQLRDPTLPYLSEILSRNQIAATK
jgi:predicted phosphodiesterase